MITVFRTPTFFISLFSVLLLIANIAYAESTNPQAEVLHLQPNQKPATATLEDVEWLQGLWSGSIEGGHQEHYISEKSANQMGGYVRGWKDDGSPWFYELTIFEESENSIVQLVRNFGPDLRAWEKEGEHIRRPLVKKTKDTLYFDGITFVNKSINEHLVYLKIAHGEHKGKIAIIRQIRQKK